MAELGIEKDIFLVACSEAEDKIHKSIVRQLLAVENFMLFKSMMVARNKALNEEALKEMQGIEKSK